MVPEESTNEVTTCRCTHFTLFAVLLDPYNVEVSQQRRETFIIFHYEVMEQSSCSSKKELESSSEMGIACSQVLMSGT